ncbi:flagellar basal body P-ring formation chaperone FlgA [Sulfurimonas microaerophilic]|uniref:flagellar basal body P-ring formation chaperone FlgA n=1 Tax=Sulfurimonas microaerophilic TaxID=3058392 RepID=UPI00271507B6|nr:flagellar basal body P-ring formation chaperone FlgA [Sulfurimonas sp. hsl 1-7]
MFHSITMYIKTIFLLLFALQLSALELQRNYFIKEDDIKLSHIITSVEGSEDRILFSLLNDRHIKRVTAKKLISTLKKLGYKDIHSKYPYIQFNKISPIDTTKIEEYVTEHYKNKYNGILIKEVQVYPRTFMEQMPKNYTLVEMRSREHLSNDGVVAIKTDQNKKIFFNYRIKAYVNIFVLKNDLQRDGELSTLNTIKNSIILDKFRAMPVQTIENGTLELKHTMKKGQLLTLRDVEPLALIKRDSSVNVTLQNGSIVISFSARALQDGRKGDLIFVENDKGKKIKVVVVGKNKAKVK